MRSLLAILVLFCVIYANNAAVSINIGAKNPEYPGKCWDSNLKMAFDIGTHHPKGHCYELHCGETFVLSTYTCGIVGPPPGYKNVIDLTKEYPDCCVNLVKVEENVEATPA